MQYLFSEALFTQEAEHLATRMQIMEHTAENRSIHTGCKQHQRVCMQICAQIYLRVLCVRGLRI